VNGLVDILFTGEDTFLALERSFTANADNPNNNQVRLYQVRIGGAQDISGIDALTDGVVGGLVGVEKTLLFDFDTLGVRIDNLEGLAFGPTLADGRCL
jgi:3-phytase